MITVVWLLLNKHDIICDDNNWLQLAKTFIKLSLKNITGYCSSKWHNYIPESIYPCIKNGQGYRSFIKLLVPITFSAITYGNDPGFCKQMGYISCGLDVIWSHNSFIEIGQEKTYSKPEISLFFLAIYQ